MTVRPHIRTGRPRTNVFQLHLLNRLSRHEVDDLRRRLPHGRGGDKHRGEEEATYLPAPQRHPPLHSHQAWLRSVSDGLTGRNSELRPAGAFAVGSMGRGGVCKQEADILQCCR
eukprot:768299-Hanusia_phi.AAC.3